uniref:PLP-dependent transferase n=1 Tax=Ndongobacter massiliensis TaxID=1871025 RepID=UPI000931DCFF
MYGGARKDDTFGGILSPFTAWLITRGLVTVPLRMEQHSRAALEVAQFWRLVRQYALCIIRGSRVTRNRNGHSP